MKSWLWRWLSTLCFMVGDGLREMVNYSHRAAYWFVRQGARSLARSMKTEGKTHLQP